MSGWTVFGFVISALISALVAILVTGKVNSSLADRAGARRLRQRVKRVLLIGPGREQLGWGGLSKDELDDVSARIVDLGEEAAKVDMGAAQALAHAAQMPPVLWRCMDQWESLGNSINRECEKIKYDPKDHELYSIREEAKNAIKCRDDGLAAIATLYRDLLTADDCLRKVGRWLRIIDWKPESEPPQHYREALKYAEYQLRGAVPWDEPPEARLEAHRVWLIAVEALPDTLIDRDHSLDRRNLHPRDPLENSK